MLSNSAGLLEADDGTALMEPRPGTVRKSTMIDDQSAMGARRKMVDYMPSVVLATWPSFTFLLLTEPSHPRGKQHIIPNQPIYSGLRVQYKIRTRSFAPLS